MGLWLAVLALGLGGCDLVTDLQPDDARPGAADSLHIGLVESGRVVTGLSGDGALQVETLAPLQAVAKAGAALEDTRHACTISLYRPDGPHGPGYYYRSARLAYPDSVLQQAGGETVHLTARLSGPIVPHPSKTSSLLRCRLPAVEGAERRVRTFFRASPKQLKASGFERVDSLKRRGTGSPKASGLSKSDCWRERTCIRAEDGSLQNCTDWEYSPCTGGGGGGSVSFGGGMGELPSGGDQTIYGTRTIDPGGIDGGFGDSGPDPEINPCESADPPEWCEIGCKLSSTELEDGYYLFDQASDSTKSTFIQTLYEHGPDYGVDSEEDVRHFIAQAAHESQGKITKVENLNYQDADNLARTFTDFTRDGRGNTYKASEYVGKPKEIAKIVYSGRLGNGKKGTGNAYKYRGRGPMQITGKENYKEFTEWYQDEGFGSTDFTENPGRLSSNARIGTLAALQYWNEGVLGSSEVDEDNLTVEDVTKAINGGTVGIDIRRKHLKRADDIDCGK